MAIDEAILERKKGGHSLSTLRLYSWRRPYCSYGYGQKLDPALRAFCEQQQIGLVRRPTGGGFVMHVREITFSVIFSRRDLQRSRALVEYYRIVSECLQQALIRLGLTVCLEEKVATAKGPASFCFSQPTKYDLMVQNRKICGSAQRRYRDTILQQGSLILDYQPLPGFWDQAGGVRQFAGRPIDNAEISQAIEQSFAERLGLRFVETGLTPEEKILAEKLVAEKYGQESWNFPELFEVINDQRN
jgi:lipoate-protein ligase A